MSDWRAVAPAAQRAEALGFDGITAPEIANDPFMPLAFAALATERIQLGTAIAVAFPRSPMVVANIAWDLHANSRGRFALGLGPQVKGHNERRFSVPWSAPVPRLREYIESLRAIWRCWELGEPLAYEGEHYRFTLMTPEFSPPASGLPPVPVTIAAVGTDMLRLAGRVCDGVRLHGFCTRALPRRGRAAADPATGSNAPGATASSFEVLGRRLHRHRARRRRGREAVRVVPLPDRLLRLDAQLPRRARAARLGRPRARSCTRCRSTGSGSEMAAQVPDEVVHEFAATAPHRELKAAVEKRFGGVVDSIALGFADEVPAGARARARRTISARSRSAFQGFPQSWA